MDRDKEIDWVQRFLDEMLRDPKIMDDLISSSMDLLGTDIDNNDSDDPRALRYNAAFAAIVRTVRDRYEIPAENNRFFTEAIKRFGDMAREKSAARNERYLY